MIYHAVIQRSPEWHRLRLGLVTASEFSRILTPKTRQISSQANDLMYRYLAEQITGEQVENAETEWMVRGVELEDAAIRAYEMLTDTETQPGGFITDDAVTMGCSPDRLVGDAGGLEIKCRLIHVQIKHALNGLAAEEAKVQVQGCLLISEREWWDVFSYHPRLLIPPLRMYRDEPFIAELRTVLKSFNEIMAAKRLELEQRFGPFVRPEPADEPPDHSADFVSDADVEMILAESKRAMEGSH